MSGLLGGITAAVVGVSDPAPHLQLWRVLGYEVAAQGQVPAADAAALWGLDAAVDVWALAPPGVDTGRVHLLRLPAAPSPAGPPDRAPRVPAPRMDRAGLQGLDLYARDLATAGAVLAGAGYPWHVAPVSYGVTVGEQVVTITEAALHGPDGVTVVLIQPGAPRATRAWEARPGALFTELTSVVVAAGDVAAEVAFWTRLGLATWYDVTVRDDQLARLAELPPGTAVRIAFLAGTQTARVEILGLPDAPPAPAPPAVPGRTLGHSGWSARTPDLDAALAAAGVPPERPPAVADTPLHGRARVATVRTPAGVAVELWEPR